MKENPKRLNLNKLTQIKESSYIGMVDTNIIRKEHNISYSTVYRALQKLNLYHTDQHIIEIIKRYLAGEKVSDLKHKFNMSQANINSLLRRRGITKRYNHFDGDFNYFSNIDTSTKAYFLGFIYADGCVYRNSLRISIKSIDHELLMIFKKDMASSHPIIYSEINDMVSFEITSKKLVEDLKLLGVHERKSLTLDFPENLPIKFHKDFIRGYLDGDGCIVHYINKESHKYSVKFIGTKEMMEGIRNTLQIYLDIPLKAKLTQRFPNREKNNWNLEIHGRKQTLKVLSWIYDDATVYLERKFQKFNSLPLNEHLDSIQLNLLAGGYIKERRIEFGFSRKKFSEIIEVSYSYLLKLENQQLYNIKRELFDHICKTLEIDYKILSYI